MQWLNLRRVSAPLDSVVSLAEAKRHLNVFHNDDDTLINSLIEAATSYVEGPNGIGIALLTQTWRASFDHVPRSIPLPLGPVQAVVDISVAGTALDDDSYAVDLDLDAPLIVPAPGRSWPSATPQPGVVKVTFRVGYGSDPEAVPMILRQAVLLLVGHYYANKGDEEIEIPAAVNAILDRFRAQM
ncbi:head-tail connector protein [uncultured Brevundimonas sp.]|uniref:head-tail connector protein n=1 Tax=uncultured Brevundimonas sp. TaxID=213418 RepID=UPI0025DA629C|nr:head-tail connector protein [uncultured Brevundimonas sp.]